MGPDAPLSASWGLTRLGGASKAVTRLQGASRMSGEQCARGARFVPQAVASRDLRIFFIAATSI